MTNVSESVEQQHADQTLLIVEDDEGLQSQLRWHFDQYNVVIAGDRKTAIEAIRMHEPAVVLQDLGLPPDAEGVQEGLDCVEEILQLAPATKIIVMTGNADYDNAVKAVALGAYDFYQKPVNTEALDLIVQRAEQMYRLEQENRKLQSHSSPMEGVIACDPKMQKILSSIERIAPSDITCTLLGESGTGKEVLAQAIHRSSNRREERFVAINCAAVPESLIESEFFGYEKGAFTGANKQTIGKVETANKGSLFLDEIGDMPLNLQAKMLRFLEEREIERVGGRESIPVDVRVICATNQNLDAMVAEGTFREDLFYRICEMTIDIPPLKDRKGDAVLIAKYFLQQFNKQGRQRIAGFSPSAINAIESYEWPGNIRELKNKVKRAAIMCDDKYITPEDLDITADGELNINLRHVRQEAERNAIEQALAIADGNMSATAKLLGITRPTLYDLIKKYEIQPQFN